jgi:chemotaxis response regulator CheB
MVVLSGLGRDGAQGAVQVAARGGCIMALDPSSTRFPVMIESVLARAPVDCIGSPDALAECLHERLAWT